jgi:predicted transposase YbfD/YdcC
VIQVKKNQPTLYNLLNERFATEKAKDVHHLVERNKGNLISRKASIIPCKKSIDWPGAKTMVMIEREGKRNNKTYYEMAFYISSLCNNALYFNECIKAHWSIENSLHWVKDVIFKEDSSKIKSGNAPENMSVIRNCAINLLAKANIGGISKTIRFIGNDIKQLINLVIKE